jgi:carboxyl-terminal processing protease
MTFSRPKHSTSLLKALVGIASILFTDVALSQTEPPTQPIQSPADQVGSNEKEFDLSLQLESFEQVWSTVANSHWDEELISNKWNALKDKYRPKIESATSTADVRKGLQAMIAELELSHFSIIDASAYDVMQAAEGRGEATAGLTFRATDDGILVSQVRKGSSGSQAGVEPGWVLEKVGKFEIAQLSEKLRKAAHGPVRYETIVGLTLKELASGQAGKTKSFRFLNREKDAVELELELAEAPGNFAQFGHLPPIKVESILETLPDKIGYYWFSAFLDPARLMPEFREMIRDEKHQGGIVIDLRGNIGGLAAMTMGMASEFSNQQTSLGVMTMKGTDLKFFVNANFNPVKGPVAVLVDECSISSAEILSGGLQDLKLAKVFGNRTAGLALPSIVIKLANGDGFQYALANYRSTSGKSLEMQGVTPDETITLTRDLLLSDPDPVLSRALDWIKDQQATNQN